MKPFNLEEALDGKPVVTRDSRKVTHITRIPNNNFIVGIIEDVKQIPQWALNGKFLNDHYTHPCDLFMFIEKKSIWVNVYGYQKTLTVGFAYETQEDAFLNKDYAGLEYIKTIEITNEI
jgi:hypothetical protein